MSGISWGSDAASLGSALNCLSANLEPINHEAGQLPDLESVINDLLNNGSGASTQVQISVPPISISSDSTQADADADASTGVSAGHKASMEVLPACSTAPNTTTEIDQLQSPLSLDQLLALAYPSSRGRADTARLTPSTWGLPASGLDAPTAPPSLASLFEHVC
jgi:hypothetical protein